MDSAHYGLCKNVLLLLHIRFKNISGPTRWKSDENMLSSEMITNGNNISHQKEGKFRTSFLRGKKNTWVNMLLLQEMMQFFQIIFFLLWKSVKIVILLSILRYPNYFSTKNYLINPYLASQNSQNYISNRRVHYFPDILYFLPK